MARPKQRTGFFESRLDWLQLGSYSDDLRRRDFIAQEEFLLRKLNEAGNTPKPISFTRYQGVELGPYKFMKRDADDHRMIIASGPRAPSFAAWAIENDLCGKCIRIDGATDITYDEPVPDMGDWAREKIHRKDKSTGRKTQTALELYDAKHASSGIKSAAKKSSIKFNIYDSGFHHQGRLDSRVWRHEVKLSNEPAQDFWAKYVQAPNPSPLVAGMVNTRMNKVGVIEPMLSHLEPCPTSGTRAVTSNEKLLIHIDRSWMTSFVRLAREGCRNDLRDMFRAHGLTDEGGVFLPPWEDED
jgi:hypothetical protein